MTELTADRLRQLLDYDPETGAFRWKSRAANCVRVGNVAGWLDKNGYRMISISGRKYFAHLLAWLWVHGRWPSQIIDHKNRTPSDNRICNLREATHRQNMGNMRLRRDNSSGVRGVSLHKKTGRWVAKIHINKATKHLGLFSTIEDAERAYRLAATEHFGEFAA